MTTREDPTDRTDVDEMSAEADWLGIEIPVWARSPKTDDD